MISALIKIRWKQFYRSLTELGLFRVLFLAGLVGFAVYILFMQCESSPNDFYAVAIYVFLLVQLQIKRRDKLFLKSHFANYKKILLAEYSLLSTPLLFCLTFHFQWAALAASLALTYFLPYLDFVPKQRGLNTKIQQLIPGLCFEWKAGIRKTLLLIVPIWMIGMATSFYIGSVPLVLFVLGLIPLNFYENGEPLQMLIAFERSSNKFLFQKIKMQTILFSILALPLMAAFLVFHPDRWYIPVVEYLLFISLHIYAILLKYAFYVPNSKSSAAQTFGAIGAIGTLIPFFIPLVWLLSVRFYFKSIKTLNFYLNDFN
jgi:hypothetical protein